MTIYNSHEKQKKIITDIGTWCSIASVPLFFIDKIIGYFTSKDVLPKYWANSMDWLGSVSIVLLVLGIAIILTRVIMMAIGSRVQALHIQLQFASFFHQELNHKIRNHLVDLDNIKIKFSANMQKGAIDAINELYNSEYSRMKDNLQDFIDSLSDFLTKYREDEISVCIKLFKSRDENRQSFDDENIITVVRSSNTKKTRQKDNEESLIKRNTDFHNLCSGRNVFFGSSNLLKLSESGQYESDSENWNTEPPSYLSTIVTPIRYYNNDNNKIRIDIIGFLCIDSIKEINVNFHHFSHSNGHFVRQFQFL